MSLFVHLIIHRYIQTLVWSVSVGHTRTRLLLTIPIMPASRDDDVYQAKLAEQAERYEGKEPGASSSPEKDRCVSLG